MAILQAIYDQLNGDATLNATLTGGVYLARNLSGMEITRQSAAAAFDANLELKPCALIRERDLVQFGPVRDLKEQTASGRQVVEVYFYQYLGQGSINTAKDRVYALMQGTSYADAYDAMWLQESPPVPGDEIMNGVIAVRQEWEIISIREAA